VSTQTSEEAVLPEAPEPNDLLSDADKARIRAEKQDLAEVQREIHEPFPQAAPATATPPVGFDGRRPLHAPRSRGCGGLVLDGHQEQNHD